MPTAKKKTSRSGPRIPPGKKQMLVLIDIDVAKEVKIAAIQHDVKMSHIVEIAVREWLAKRGG